MRAAVRTKTTTEPQLELFTVNTLRIPIYETTHSIWTDRQETLARISAENGRGTRSEERAPGNAADSGGTDRNGTGPDSEKTDSAGTDTATGPRPGLGNGLSTIHLPAARVLADGHLENPEEGVGQNSATGESEPLRNQNNYRITEADKIGTGSLKQKCRDNLAAITLLKKLEAENRPPTDDEKRVLVRYVGWGGLPQMFDALNEPWRREREQLESLLTEAELDSARATTLNAHYTAPVVIRAMYSALERFGFRQGRVLEPALGLGHFIGLMPQTMQSHSLITGVEIDSITARLARRLYPDADIRHQPFEETKLADGFYDVTISNIPFGDYKPFDPRFKSWSFLIHDYFFAKALDKVRPGGLILFITSRGTMDKVDGALREYVSNQADLLGAIRLPNDAFKKNANTEVTTDIVMLRKRLWQQCHKIGQTSHNATGRHEGVFITHAGHRPRSENARCLPAQRVFIQGGRLEVFGVMQVHTFLSNADAGFEPACADLNFSPTGRQAAPFKSGWRNSPLTHCPTVERRSRKSEIGKSAALVDSVH